MTAKKKTPGDVPTPAEIETAIESPEFPEVAPPPAKKKSSSGSKASGKMTYEELQQKLSRTMNFISFVTKSQKSFTENDFCEEAKDLARLSVKYETVSSIISLLDPLFFLFGMVSKFKDILAARPTKKDQPEPAATSADLVPGYPLIN